MPQHLTRTVLWKRLDQPGLEYAMLQSSAKGGWLIQGDVVGAIDGMPSRVVYQVRVDHRWHTHRLAVDVLVGGTRHRLHIINHARRGWRTRPDNRALPHLDGCIDVDLGISPVTNTLAINRLKLGIDQEADVTTAWVRFPEKENDVLSIAPLAQRYKRLAGRRYLYRSGDSYDDLSYQAILEVDDLGLITYYEGAWERVTQADSNSDAISEADGEDD